MPNKTTWGIKIRATEQLQLRDKTMDEISDDPGTGSMSHTKLITEFAAKSFIGQGGPAGPPGPAGADSTVPGPQGPAGADSTVAGPQGPIGLTGPKGDSMFTLVPSDSNSAFFNKSGNVGIGTPDPQVKFEIASPYDAALGNSFFNGVFVNNRTPYFSNVANAPARISFGRGTPHGYMEAGSHEDNNSTAGYLAFGAAHYAAPSEVMRIANTRLLIGSTNDDGTHKVQITGLIKSDGFIGNASTATTLLNHQRQNFQAGPMDLVAALLIWKAYGNNHVIFDASGGISPDGTPVNTTNASVGWNSTLPNLMGWNGVQTHGVRVESANTADKLNGLAYTAFLLISGGTVTGIVLTSAGGAAGAGTNPFATDKYIQSRGENLVTNGTGLLENNYNFPSMTFDPVDTFSGAGSFKIDTPVTGTFISQELIPIDPLKTYELSAYGKSGNLDGSNFNAGNYQFFGVACFDIDGIGISPLFFMRYPGATDTTLAATLNPGDTTMQLTNAAGWCNAPGSQTYERAFCWYPYTNAKGYSYPDYTYTQHNSYSWNSGLGTWEPGAIVGNTITLTQPWQGAQLIAGTAVRNVTAGSSYKYIAASYAIVPGTWTKFSGIISGIDYAGTNNEHKFPHGTAFVKVVFLSNYHGAADNVVRWNNISFKEKTVDTIFSLANTNDAHFLPSGNLGIGTASPTHKLEVAGAIKATQFKIEGGGITGFHTQNGVDIYGTYAQITSHDSNGIILVAADNGFISFKTNNAIRAFITDAGKFGIGTDTPANTLSIVTPAAHVTAQDALPTPGTPSGNFGFFKHGGLYGLVGGVLGSGNAYFQVQRIDGSAVAYDLLLQPAGGRIGVGIDLPAATLQVYGDMMVGTGSKNYFDGGAALQVQRPVNTITTLSIHQSGVASLLIGSRANDTTAYISNDYFGIEGIGGIDNSIALDAYGRMALGTRTPNAAALLDLASTTRGLLLPRMTTTQINAIPTPPEGLIVFDTTLHLSKFYDGTAWRTSELNWSKQGNSGTNPATDFLGTTDNTAFNFKTNNQTRFNISAAGVMTLYKGLVIYDNSYSFLEYRRNVPNDLSIFKIYATGDFDPILFETQGNQFLKYSRTYNNVALNGAYHVVGDNDGGDQYNSTIVKNLIINNGTSNTYLTFWTPYAAQAARGRIGCVDGAAARSGDMYFSTNYGGLGPQALTERMRIKASGNILIGTSTDVASSIHTLESTTKGALLPRMSKTQRDAIPSPAQGLMVFVTDNGGYLSWYNSGWHKISSTTD